MNNLLASLRATINQSYLADETTAIEQLYVYLQDYDPSVISECAGKLVAAVRSNKNRQPIADAFLNEYQLDNAEGIVLMSIAEALLRIPDAETQDLFLQEKLASADWREHLQHSDSFLVNLSTHALLMTGELENHLLHTDNKWQKIFDALLSRLGQPIIRTALKQAMQQLAYQFVIADSIEQALQVSDQNSKYCYSFDMLGEAALTAADANRYYTAYSTAIDTLAKHRQSTAIFNNPGISIKLSALCPRFEPLQHRRAVNELTGKLLALAIKARDAGISLTIDAEESERLEMTLDIFAAVYSNPDLHNWQGLGLAIQAYQKRAIAVIQWLAKLALCQQRKIPLRLVKGAYWDSEIKHAQEQGLDNYPVFTHKTATDVSYLACAKLILSQPDAFYPQFATHNAHTLAAVFKLAKNHPGYEFQRLHGMGEQLYEEIVVSQNWQIPCRIYAPVGNYQDLLPYLVRRLLENGANTSFISQAVDPAISIEEATADPLYYLQHTLPAGPAPIILPKDLFAGQRQNSQGFNLHDPELLQQLQQQLNAIAEQHWLAYPLVNGQHCEVEREKIVSPHANDYCVGTVTLADSKIVKKALDSAAQAFANWRSHPVAARAQYLLQTADLLEKHRLELVSLCIREGGRTIKDALNEVREAVDYCRYYASTALAQFAEPLPLPAPTGEENKLYHFGRGTFVCISPWNFPIAIFVGQISAALAAGNTVIAKPARLTPLTAFRCIQLLHQGGIPENVLHFLPGDGASIGQQLFTDPQIAGVAFTGSTLTAQMINRQLAEHQQRILPLIAETGGQNVMIADSSALAEQVVQDTIQSAFNSAGQRCSALRVLFLQQQVADRIIEMLIGAMQELVLGDPGHYATDIGPVISHVASKQLAEHLLKMQQQARLLYQLPLAEHLQNGSFFPPCLIELTALSQLTQEVFGPVLHIIRYRTADLEQVIDAVNATGYGLTLGIHSRIESTIQRIQQAVRVGNIYVNRNMIGAVVGVQPFGGMELSGSGPKAGGPDYLQRFTVEQTLTTNTAAIGGNASLMAKDLR
jgi:RHH-type transcriptional regulator, proline utilization regulon repressor / proline dehydrogenase / delta 1-pyrroline-5-carboxylate dehydrogenase